MALHEQIHCSQAHALHLNMGIFRTVALCTGAFQVTNHCGSWCRSNMAGFVSRAPVKSNLFAQDTERTFVTDSLLYAGSLTISGCFWEAHYNAPRIFKQWQGSRRLQTRWSIHQTPKSLQTPAHYFLPFVDIEERHWVSHLLFASITISSATATNWGSVWIHPTAGSTYTPSLIWTGQPWYWKPGYMEIFKLMPRQWWPASALLLQPLAFRGWSGKWFPETRTKEVELVALRQHGLRWEECDWFFLVSMPGKCAAISGISTHVRKIM